MVRSLRLSLRFLLPLALAMLAMAYFTVPVVDSLTLRWFMRDLDIRAGTIGRALEEPVLDAVERDAWRRVDSQLERIASDERLLALGVCNVAGDLVRKTRLMPGGLDCRTVDGASEGGAMVRLSRGPVHVAAIPLRRAGVHGATLLLVHDLSFVERRSQDTRYYVIILFTVLGMLLALISMLVAHMSWRGWVAGVRAMLQGEGVIRPFSQPRPELQPLVGDLRSLLRDIERERRSSDQGVATNWDPEMLRRLLHEQLRGDEILLVSNREPYIHVESERGVEVQRPASGLVTAVEPVMRACSGTWIAHGSGSADRAAVDSRDRLRVPPGEQSYTLRRIWLTEQEERGYYYGFANEGLWPLCHIAHVRPVFRDEDWRQYRRVNERFADAVAQEAKTDDPVVLIQDYHFALLPRLVRERLPRATIITFWHIPWPNPESFGICPWRSEILEGLLGSTILGFHTRYHGHNFLEAVDRFLEARIEHESSTVSFGGRLTRVESFPISIAWPDSEAGKTIDACRAEVRARLGVRPDHLVGLGVDRLDYTKGIVERLLAVERLFELHPEWIGRFTFVQIAAPSRSSLDEYQRFEAQVRATALQINARFGKAGYEPVRMLIEHHGSASVTEHYRAADVCVVTSLHDGMNLVAKEYVAARDDERGVLVLSQFAGAARELHEALIVNPYHVEEVAEAMHRALSMPPEEQRERMISLRQLVREFNVYRWAGRMLMEAARLRQRERISARIGETRGVA
ncbi:MAG: alpha,alpha-trehalose-phosphate synthase (UDP-forming) [Betaproteobacteria bacterium]